MSSRSYLKWLLFWGVLAGLALLAWPLSVLATAYHTITIDGTNDFAADEDIPGTNGSTWYFTWDADYFYFGTANDNVDDNDPNKWVVIYLDTDPQVIPTGGNGTSIGVQYNTQQPTLPFNADFHLRWKNDNTYTNLQRWNGTAWVDGDQTNVSAYQNGTFVEFRIPRSNLGNPSAVYVVGSMLNEQSMAEYTYYMVPNTNSEGYDANFTHYLGFVLADQLAPDHPANNDCRPAQPVTDTADSGVGTLRNAIQTTCHGGTITFTVNGVITLTTGQLPITRSLTISGPGASVLALSGNNASRIITITQGVTVNLSGLTLRDGRSDYGGGLYNAGTLTAYEVNFSNNVNPASGINLDAFGGAIFNVGTLALENATLYSNTAGYGGGIANGGTLVVQQSLIYSNAASTSSGGGLYGYGGTAWITNTTFSANRAGTSGSAVTAGSFGGITVGNVILNSTTITNGAHGTSVLRVTDSIAAGTPAITVTNSIVGRVAESVVCSISGTLSSGGSNFANDSTCAGFTQVSDLGLGPLQDNGGDTWTHALLYGSPALDAGSTTACPAIDQRGVSRPQGARCDSGAYESDTPELNIVKMVEPALVSPGETVTYTLLFSNSGYGTATAAVLTDIIPVSLTVQSVLSSGVTLTDTGTVPPYVWEVEPLAPGEGGLVTITAILSPALPVGGWITNTATVAITATEFWITNNESVAAFYVPVADLAITKAVTPALAAPGETVTYTLAFSNAGPDMATGVVLADLLPISVSVQSVISSGVPLTETGSYVWQVADLVPGASGIVTITALVNPGLYPNEWITNTAIIAATTLDPAPADNQDMAAFVTPATLDLAVTKYADPEPAVAGESITYTIIISNLSPYTATLVTLTDTLHLSTTLQTVHQRDQDAADFAAGTHNNTRWNNDRPYYDEWLEQVNPTISGTYTSRVFDAGQDGATWTTLTWRPRRPYWKPLPNNNSAEWGYDDGNADMWGNRILLHLDGTGTPFADSSGNALNATCITCPTTGTPGRFNTAIEFDGTLSQTVIISDVVNPTRYALELWVYPTAVTTSSLILRTDTLSGTEYHYSHMLGIVGDRFFHMVNDGSERWAIGSTVVQTNTWYHLVGTAESGGDLRLYVNGVEEAVVHRLGTLWSGGDQYVLGAGYGLSETAQYYSGRIDEVAVYTRTLASSEVLAHYLRGALRADFEVRSCAAPDCSDGTWVGPYSEQTNTGLTIPAVDISVPANRYFQYRVALETDQPGYRPQIEWVQVAPAHYVVVTSRGTYTTALDGKAFTCTVEAIGPGETVIITAWADIARNLTGTITNTVWITAPDDIDEGNNTAWVTSTVESHVDINVYKYDEYWVDNETFVGGDPVNPGYPITYTLIAYNAGPSDAWNVTITDTLPVTITEVLTPGGWANCEWTTQTLTCTTPHLPYNAWRRVVVVAEAPSVTGSLTNTAWITAEASLVRPTSNLSDTEVTAIEPLADLSIAKVAEPSPADPAGVITYTITVTNSGPSDALGVWVTDTLSGGHIGYALPAAGWTCMPDSGSEIVCSQAVLTAGTSSSFQVTVTAPVTGVVENMAETWAATIDPLEENNRVYLHLAVRPMADLIVTKTVNAPTVLVGTPLTYTITVSNAGPTDAGATQYVFSTGNGQSYNLNGRNRAAPYRTAIHVTGVEGQIENLTVTLNQVSDPYPADLRLLLVGPNGNTVLLMANAGGGTDIVDLDLTWNDAGVTMPISDPLASDILYRPTNHGFGGSLPAPAPSGPYGSNLSAFNGSNPNGLWWLYVYDEVADGGGEIRGWTITLTTRTTDTVIVSDTLPVGLSAVTLSGRPADWNCALIDETLLCQFARLPLESMTVVTLTATAPITPGVITNTVWITSTTLDPITDSNTAWVTTTVIAVADLEIVKTVEPIGLVGAGAPLTYTLTITNHGPGPAIGPIFVTDLLPVELTGVITGGLGWNCDLALPQITCTLNADLAVDEVSVLMLASTAPFTPGLVLTNTAGVWPLSAFDPITDNNTAWITVTVAPQANLEIVKTVEPTLALPGETLTYTLLITNHGPSAAAYVTITDQIENAAALGDPSGANCLRTGDAFTCTITGLDALSGTTILVTATAPAANGRVTNTAWITSTEADLQPENNQDIAMAIVTLPPIAVAGPDQTVHAGTVVTLDGSSSYDPDNDLPLDYGWQQTGGPTVALSNPAAVQPTFTAPATPAVFTFTLRVTDALGASCLTPDEVVITVTNQSPIAVAGPDQTVYVDDLVTLDGSSSYDPDNDLPLGYGWQQTGGPTVALSNPAAVQPTFTAPATPAVLTFTLQVTDALGMPCAVPDVVVITVIDRAIGGLQAFNDSPTMLGNPTALWATVVTGTNVTYQWAFGDGQGGNGISVTHTYVAQGLYTAIVTATNSVGSITATTQVSITKSPTTTVYLPLVMRNYVTAPDLVVEQIVATANSVQVVVRNVGPKAIEKDFANEFWVDLYINPTTPPTAVNQTWRHVGSRGVAWGVTQDALPLQPGQAITLTVTPAGGLYVRPDQSNVTWPLPAGTVLYAQADSAHSSTTYGAILENHEIIGTPYNNITGPVLSVAGVDRYRASPRR